jgi:outer membrane immunogenic protein
MRTWIMAAALLVSVQTAQTALAADMPDFPVLRGGFDEGLSRSAPNWEGWYAGGQFGYSSGSLDLSNSSRSLTNAMLANSILQAPVAEWTVLNTPSASGIGFGGFVGRNWQWSDAIVGFEVNYSNLRSIKGSSTGQQSLLIAPGGFAPPLHTYSYGTTLFGSATAEVKDLVTLRGRIGWDAGTYMPYLFGGVAVGRVNVTRSATLNVIRNDDYTVLIGGNIYQQVRDQTDVSPTPATRTEGGVDSYAGGYTMGLGTEMNIYGGWFLRAEYEYVKLVKVKDVAITLNSARAGLGYKF